MVDTHGLTGDHNGLWVNTWRCMVGNNILKTTIKVSGTLNTNPLSGQYLTHAHSHITRAVALLAPTAHNTCGSWWLGTARQFSQGMRWEGGSALIADWCVSKCDMDRYAMLMRPNKAETAVHGFHCPCDMAVRMRKVLARPWVGVECVTCFYCCFYIIYWHTDRQLRLNYLPSVCLERTAVQLPATSSHMCCVELTLKGVLAPPSAVKGRQHRAFSPISPRQLCHADETSQGQKSNRWLPLPGWYDCAHA